MLAHKYLLLAKIEANYGVDPSPSATVNAFITTEPSIDYLEKSLDRNIVIASYGKKPPLKIGEGIKISFATEVTGSGALGTAPFIGPLLRACNFTQTINAGVSVVYAPNSSEAGESVTIYFHKDGHLHKALGCVGTFKFSGVINEVARFEFEFTGLYGGTAGITDVAFPSFTYDTADPIIFRSAVASVHVYTVVLKSINFDIGAAVNRRTDGNAATGIARYWISQREVKGNVVIDTPALSALNPYALWSAQTEGVIGFIIGQTSTKKCNIAMTKCTLDLSKYGAEENQLTWDIPFNARPNAGNDEITLTFV